MAALAQLRDHWRAWVLNVAFIALLLCAHTYAYGDEPGSGELRLISADGQSTTQLSSTRVDVNVHSMVAQVIVRQHFANPTEDWAQRQRSTALGLGGKWLMALAALSLLLLLNRQHIARLTGRPWSEHKHV